MHRGGSVRAGCCSDNRFARHLAHMGDAALGGRGLRHGEGSAHVAAERLFLVAGLRSPQTLKAGRTIARKQDQRHAGSLRLHHGRVPVRHGRARRAHHAHGAPSRFRQAKSEEGRTALIHIQVQVEGCAQAAVRLVGNHGKRGGTRTGAYHHIVDAGAHQLVEEGAYVSAQVAWGNRCVRHVPTLRWAPRRRSRSCLASGLSRRTRWQHRFPPQCRSRRRASRARRRTHPSG